MNIPGLLLFAAYLAAGILLYILVPLKGISWAVLFVLQAFGSYYFFRLVVRKKGVEYEFRVSVIRHFFCQICLFAVWCLAGFLSHKILSSKPGWLAFGLCMVATLLYFLFVSPNWVFGLKSSLHKAEKWFYRYDLYFYAFFTVVTLHLLLYAIFSVYPFGDSLYLRMDCYHQYAPFIKEFYDKMRNGEGLLFNFHSGLGVNYFTHFGYYLSSPTTFLYLLLPENLIVEGIEASIMVKGGLAAVSFLYYLNSRKGGRCAFRFIFACFYALSAFYLAYSCNIMWADSYVLFPLIMLGLERIAKGKSGWLYGISMCLCVFSNFYMAAIIAIAIVLYFLVQLIVNGREGNTFKKIGTFVFATLVAGMIAAVLLLPEYYCLRNTAAGGTEFPKTWESYFKFHELFERFLANVNTIQNNSELPNVYCGILALVSLLYYFGNRRIRLVKKITNGILVAFLLLSFQWNILYYVWHGLHFPNSFPARFSFFLIFLLLSMAAESFEEREGVHQVYLAVSSGVVFILCIVFWWILSRDNVLNALSAYLCSAVLIAVYTALLMLEPKFKGKTVKSILSFVLLLELSVNTLCVGVNSVVDREDYLSNEPVSDAALEYIADADSRDFVRMERPDKKYMNEGCWDDYNSASYFSSTISDGVKQFYADLGMRYSDVAYSYQGGNPFLGAFLGIDYYVAEEEQHMGNEYTEVILPVDETKQAYVYHNVDSLGIGFAISKEAFENYPEMEGQRPFKNQIALAKSLGAYGNLFLSLPAYEFTEGEYNIGNGKTRSGKATVYQVKAGEHPYFYVVNYLDSIRIINRDIDGNFIDSRTESGLKFRHILDLGVYDTDRSIVFLNDDDAEEELTFQAYCFNESAYRELKEILSRDKFEADKIKNNQITGSIVCSQDEYLLFSLPYDDGFTVKVDGKAVETEAYGNAFLCVYVGEGEHDIEVSFFPPGLKAGGLISLGGILIVLTELILLAKRRRSEYN